MSSSSSFSLASSILVASHQQYLTRFWELVVTLGAMSPYLSNEEAKEYLAKPYSFTVTAVARDNNKTGLNAR